MRVYKLTTQDNKTRPGFSNETLWGDGVTHTASGEGEPCSKGWLHAYESADLALFMNPSNANIQNPKLWEAEAEGTIKHEALKLGCTQLTTLIEIAYTPPTREQCIRFGILCALEVYTGPAWVEWANRWLDGTDRTISVAAKAAYNACIADAAHSAVRAYTATRAYTTAARAYTAGADNYAAAAASAAADFAANRSGTTPIDFDAICKAAMAMPAGGATDV